MDAPPFEAGADQETVADAFPGEAITLVGALGVVAGVMLAELPAGPVPTLLVAVTAKV
jgi:hypothetical protein